MAKLTSVDANGSTVSGAIDVTNVDESRARTRTGGSRLAGASQFCLTVVPGSSYEIAVHTFIRSGQGSGWAGFILEDYFAAGCSGAPWSVPFVSPQVTATGAWHTVTATTTQIPLGIASVGVRLVAAKPTAVLARGAFDDVLVRVK